MLCIPENSGSICLVADGGGQGGVAGGGGSSGQASLSATGVGASSYGFPVLEATTGMTCPFSVQLTKDTAGAIRSDLLDITSVVFKARPAAGGYSEMTKECTYTQDGIVSFELGPEELNFSNGIWHAEFLCYNGDLLVQDYRAYLSVRKGMVGSYADSPSLTVMDIRMAIMDTSPEANQLIDDLEFSDVLILNAAVRCIDEWNETPPTLAQRFDATNFPYREHWTKGAVGYLMQAIAYRYNRNRMQYSAAGLNIDTNDKGPMYIQLAGMAREEWLRFVAAKKTEHNMAECFGTFSMPYFGGSDW